MYRVKFSLSVIRLSCPLISASCVRAYVCAINIYVYECVEIQIFIVCVSFSCTHIHTHTHTHIYTYTLFGHVECNEVKTCTCICFYICNKFISDEVYQYKSR